MGFLGGLKKVGKFVFKHKDIVTAVVPGGNYVEMAMDYVDMIMANGNDPGTGSARRATALRWLRRQTPELYEDYTDEQMHTIIQIAFMKRQHPELFQ